MPWDMVFPSIIGGLDMSFFLFYLLEHPTSRRSSRGFPEKMSEVDIHSPVGGGDVGSSPQKRISSEIPC